MRDARTLFVALASLISGSVASAQTIRGAVVDPGGRAVSGVVVFMLDSGSAVVARALSDERGAFRIGAARAGAYRLRTMRIGYRPTTSDPIPLLLGGEVEKRITLSGAQVALDTVHVVDRNSCRVASDASAVATFAVLEQARTALSAAQLTLSGTNVRATTVAYDRVLDAEGRRITKQSSRTTTAYVRQPWQSISPDSSHRAGFVSYANDNSVTYYAPSIDVLLSNVFVEDHCFRTVADRKHEELIGVAFEPSPDRKKTAEIKGTLWLNRKSAELQRLEYRYVNISSAQEDAGAGGEVSFARLADGGWVVSRWMIRMPILELVVRSQQFGGNLTRIAAIQVTGGEIQLATRAGNAGVDTLWSRPGVTLSGLVVDSARGAPIANAHVDLLGTALSAVSDARGRFSIANVLPGTYSVETVTPDLDRIGAANESTIAFADTTATYQIRVPTAAQLGTSICGRTLSTSEAAIVGRVRRRGDTTAVAGADVVAEWAVTSLRDEHGAVVERTTRRITAKTSSEGAYRLCGVPPASQISVSAFTPSAASGPRLLFTGGQIVRADMLIEAGVQRTATFAGKVRSDSLKSPIEGAEIFFPELAKLARSGADGSFSIGDIPAGEQHVVVRRVGYGPLDTKVTFRPDAVVERDVFLAPATVLDPVVVTDRLTERALADFEENRRIGLGHFLDRAELAKQRDVKLSALVAQWPGLQLAFGTGGRVWIAGTRKAPPPCRPNDAGCYESSGWYFPDQSEAQLGVKVACYAQVYIDGVLMNHGTPTRPFEANELYAEQIEALEWYAGGSETPGRYAGLGSDCGVLVVHWRRSP